MFLCIAPHPQVTFDYRGDEFPLKKFSDRSSIGFIAQDLEEVVPELVSTNSEVSWAAVGCARYALSHGCSFGITGVEACSVWKYDASARGGD
jgi:hypothetical protein